MFKKKSLSYISIILIILIGVVFIYYDNLQKKYIHLLKKTILVEHYTKDGRLDGLVSYYEDGKIRNEVHFINGSRHGWMITYNDNGNVKNRIYYQKDQPNGREEEFYSDGKLNYIANWKYGKKYGSEHHYSSNGSLLNYDSFDLESLFCYVKYDNNKAVQILGDSFSSNLFSDSSNTDSTIILKNGGSYKSISNLNITIAHPPTLFPKIQLYVNGIQVSKLNADSNTIRIKNIFLDKGTYNLMILGQLIDLNRRIFKVDTLKMQIIKL